MGADESVTFNKEDADLQDSPDSFYDDLETGSDTKSAKYSRIDGERMMAFMADNELADDDGDTMMLANVTKMPYNGYWSIRLPGGKCPVARSGHFTAYSDELRTCFIGYGKRRNGELLNDVWAFDVDDYKWTKLKLTGDNVSPRFGSVATMMGNYIVIFGGEGEQEGEYFSDLHTIDVTTGEVMFTQAKGTQPAKRADPVMAIYRKRLYIWGGYNGNDVSELNVMDFASMKWGIVDTDIPGRPDAAWTVYRQRILLYGGAKTKGTDFICVDMKNCDVTSVLSQGTAPNSLVTNAGMVKAGGYLLFFGGRSKSQYTMVYACELSTLWWFVFFVAPDGETTSLSDGKISPDGVFELPRTHSFSSIYDPYKREVLAFLGHPHKNPTPIFVLQVGQALSFLNLREDMMAMLELSLNDDEY